MRQGDKASAICSLMSHGRAWQSGQKTKWWSFAVQSRSMFTGHGMGLVGCRVLKAHRDKHSVCWLGRFAFKVVATWSLWATVYCRPPDWEQCSSLFACHEMRYNSKTHNTSRLNCLSWSCVVWVREAATSLAEIGHAGNIHKNIWNWSGLCCLSSNEYGKLIKGATTTQSELWKDSTGKLYVKIYMSWWSLGPVRSILKYVWYNLKTSTNTPQQLRFFFNEYFKLHKETGRFFPPSRVNTATHLYFDVQKWHKADLH